MWLFDSRETNSVAIRWKELLLLDTAWFVVAALIALIFGIGCDLILRDPPLGLANKTAVERVLDVGVSAVQDAGAIGLVSLEEVDALLMNPDVISIDARPSVFYEMGHLPGALNLSRAKFDDDIVKWESSLRSSRKTLLIYCTDVSCEDGATVARLLQRRGLGPLRVFRGGFAEWEASGRPVETSP